MNAFTSSPRHRRTAARLGLALGSATICVALTAAAAAPAQAAVTSYRSISLSAYDMDRDGRVDSFAADMNRDGYYDTYGILARSGRIFAVALDQNENGVVDSIAVDVNLNGRMDRVMYDRNEDGRFDSAFLNAYERGWWVPINIGATQQAAQQTAQQASPTSVTFSSQTWANGIGEGEASSVVKFLRENPNATSIPGVAGVLTSVINTNARIGLTNSLPAGSVLVTYRPRF